MLSYHALKLLKFEHYVLTVMEMCAKGFWKKLTHG